MADESAVGTIADEDDDKPLPAKQSGSSKRYLDDIVQAEKAFRDYHNSADKIDKLYADLLRQSNPARDREFAMFWANIQVQAPSVYARPPVPVVVPKFKDRRPVPRTASEMLERSTVVAFDLEDIDQVMRMVRDDLCVVSRGAAWVRYETKGKDYATEKVCIEHLDRKDFVHDPARKWKEVGWVARRAWLTKPEMRKRFRKTSGDEYKNAEYGVQKEDRDNGAADNRAKAGVWEIWHKDLNKVIWVAPGCDKVLDEDEPHLTLEGFFPCPRPAYGTLQRRSLVPVPDMAFYKDQLEEINELTSRIASLTEAVKVRGFYPAGAGEIGDAIEAALKSLDNNQIMVPISNWAAFGNGSAKDTIVWLPVKEIVDTIVALVELRRQLIDDVYQITGLSDIMRGATDPDETLGAQELKSQYGSIRIRDKQNELVRMARDIARISAEIMAENFSPKTLLAMSQMELPTNADLAGQQKQIVAQAEAEVQAAIKSPEFQQQAQQNPQAAQEQLISQAEQKVGAEIEKLKQQPTVEQVMSLLREERLRPFVLDIETDSTIQPDENREKELRAEFLQALGGTMQQLAGLMELEPAAAPFAGEVLKFALAPYRAGRQLDASVDELIEQMKGKAGQPKPNPEAEAAQMEAQAKAEATQADMALKQAEDQRKQQEAALNQKLKQDAAAHEAQLRDQKAKEEMAFLQEQRANAAAKHAQDMEKGALEIKKRMAEIAAVQSAPNGEEGDKPPSESISFKDLPPEGQVQMAAQAGISISTGDVAAEQARQQAVKEQEQAAKAASKPA